MAGLKQICKLYGGMVINGKRYVWDYAEDKAVPEDEMPPGSERHKRSEMAVRIASGIGSCAVMTASIAASCWSICDD